MTLRYRGRQITHQEVGLALLERFKADIADIAKVDQEPRLEGRQVMMVLSPIK